MFLLLGVGGCAPELDKLEDQRSERDSLGAEIYKALCRRVAGTELPADIDGSESETLCLGEPEDAAAMLEAKGDELPARLVVLAKRRAELVQALDDVFADEVSDELDALLRKMLPFYDDERIQDSTRALASVLRFLADDERVLAGLETLGRPGMVPPEGSYGVLRASFGYDDLNTMFGTVLPVATKNPKVRPYFEAMLKGLAFELATSELDDAEDSDTRRLKDLLTRTHPDLASGDPLYTAVRDERGVPVPESAGGDAVPFPFVDDDDDGLADLAGGRFVVAEGFRGEIPTPFEVPNEGKVQRDRFSRAYGFGDDGNVDKTRQLWKTTDADATVLAGVLREAGKVFAEETQIAVKLAKVVPLLFGEKVETEQKYGRTTLTYQAPDTRASTRASPVIDLAYGASSFVDQAIYDESLDLTLRLVRDHEAEWVKALEPLLTLERRTRRGNDAYPNADLADDSLLWDQLFYESERLSRRRKVRDGETAVEALMRAALGYARNLDETGAPIERVYDLETLRHQGAVLATLMRFKDDWRSNPKGESKREPGEDAVRGAFKTPVDRSKADTPVTCGKAGCGGLLAGSPFEDWLRRDPNQVCLLEYEGVLRDPKECGAAPNQSLYQRSLGLIWEMADRSQCNKEITIEALLEFSTDPCRDAPVGPGNQPLACDEDADCPSSEYYCNLDDDTCAAKKGTDACRSLVLDFKQNTIPEAAKAVTDDYTCYESDATAACNTDAALANYPGAFILVPGAEFPAIQPCALLDLPDVGRTFGRALTHEYVIEVPNPWVRRYLEDVARAADSSLPTCAPGDVRDPREIPKNAANQECVPNAAKLSRSVYQDMPATVDELGELIEFLLDDSSLFPTQKDTEELRPDVKALSRVLFAPAGSTSFIMFDPLLVHGAPPACPDPRPNDLKVCLKAQGNIDEPGSCCIGDLTDPPLRYRLDTYYGATTFSWEAAIKFSDGTELSFIDSMKSLSDAINRTDFDPATDDEKDFEGTDYVFSTIGKLVAEHYDSPNNPVAQTARKQAPFYRRGTNLVSYEAMIADALDDGMIDDARVDTKAFDDAAQQLGLMYHSLPVLETLDAMSFGADRDGIDVAADMVETLLSAHARCAGATGDKRVINGVGACDAAVARVPGFVAPLTYRDGTTYICWNDGTCFDGTEEKFRYVSPMYIIVDALSDIDDRISGDPETDEAFDAAVGALLDSYLGIAGNELEDRRVRALLLVGTEYIRERWAAEKAAGKLSSFQKDLTDDLIDIVRNPVFAGMLGMLEGMLEREESLVELSRYAFAVLDDTAGTGNQRALLAAAADFVQALPGDENTNALVQALAEAILPGSSELPADGDVMQGLVWQNMALLRDSVKLDQGNALGTVLNNLVRDHSSDSANPRPSALEVLSDVLMELNRVDPGRGGVMAAGDWKALLERMADVMTDERRGFERLYRIVQCRNGGDGCE